MGVAKSNCNLNKQNVGAATAGRSANSGSNGLSGSILQSFERVKHAQPHTQTSSTVCMKLKWMPLVHSLISRNKKFAHKALTLFSLNYTLLFGLFAVRFLFQMICYCLSCLCLHWHWRVSCLARCCRSMLPQHAPDFSNTLSPALPGR